MSTGSDESKWEPVEYLHYYESLLGKKLSEEDRLKMARTFNGLSAMVNTNRFMKSDPIYVSAWLAFIKLNHHAYKDIQSSQNYYKGMKSSGIGLTCPSFHIAWASFEFDIGNTQKADSILKAAFAFVNHADFGKIHEASSRLARLTGSTAQQEDTQQPKTASHMMTSGTGILTPPKSSSSCNSSSLTSSADPGPSRITMSCYGRLEQHQHQHLSTQLTSITECSKIGTDSMVNTFKPIQSQPRESVAPLVPPLIMPDNALLPKLENTIHTRTERKLGHPKRLREMMGSDEEKENDAQPTPNIPPIAEERAAVLKEPVPLVSNDPAGTTRDREDRKDRERRERRKERERKSSASSATIQFKDRKYQALQQIGQGGSSKVYKVVQVEPAVPVTEIAPSYALKRVVLRDLDEATVRGFLKEIDILERFKESPYVINMIDHYMTPDRSCLMILMELGEVDLGTMLRMRVSKNVPRDFNFIRYILGSMLSSIDEVHRNRVVHCDLKPANLLLVRGQVKIIDFGIAESIERDANSTKVFKENQVGTVNYMAPEVCTHQGKFGRISDIWSIGCIVYEMVYGRAPFAHIADWRRRMKCIDDPSYEIEYPEDCKNPALLDLIKRCLVRDPTKRITYAELVMHSFLKPPGEDSSTTTSREVSIDEDDLRRLLMQSPRTESNAPVLERIVQRLRR